jgi:glycosyltransferase involved in cell wall biosynthesis
MSNILTNIVWYCHPTAGSPYEGMSYRPYYLAKYWLNNDIRPYIISSSFHHMLQHSVPQKEQVNHHQIDDIDYIRLKTPHYQNNSFKRLQSMFTYAWHFIKNIKTIEKITGKPDIIVVSSTHPFHYFPLYRYAKKNNIPMIFEVRDLWPSSLIELLNYKKYHPLILFLQFTEKHAYKHSNIVVSLLEYAKPYMISKGLKSEQFRYIPNGTDPTTKAISLNPEYSEIIEQLKKQNKFLIGYAGSMGPPNALEYLIESMKQLKIDYPQIHCMLIGKGINKSKLELFCKQHQLDNVTFLPSIAKPMIQSFLKLMDCLYLGWQDVALYQYGVSPNKIFDYMLAAKPIIESGGTPNGLVQQAKCGIQCKAASPLDICDSILKIYQIEQKKLDEMGKNGKEFILKNHSYPILAKKFNIIFTELFIKK